MPRLCPRLHFFMVGSAHRINTRKIPAERCRTESAGTDSGAQRKPHLPSKTQKTLFVPFIRMNPSSPNQDMGSGFRSRGSAGLLGLGWYCLRVHSVYCHWAMQYVLLRFDDFQLLTSRDFVVHAFLERVHCIIFAGPLLPAAAGRAALQNKIESCILGHSRALTALCDGLTCTGQLPILAAWRACVVPFQIFSDHPVLVGPSNRSTGT